MNRSISERAASTDIGVFWPDSAAARGARACEESVRGFTGVRSAPWDPTSLREGLERRWDELRGDVVPDEASRGPSAGADRVTAGTAGCS